MVNAFSFCSNVLCSKAWMRHFLNVVAFLGAICIMFLEQLLPVGAVVSIYGILIAMYVFGKIIFSERYRRKRFDLKGADGVGCDVVIAFYNEDPAILEASVDSVLMQRTVSIGRVILVDDGSVTAEASNRLKKQFGDDERVIVIRNEENRGKRHALCDGFKLLISPYVAVMDSDTVVAVDALGHLVSRMVDGTEAVTANIGALNREDNWLTRLIDARYRNAFLIERAAHSMFDSVLCATGVLTLYRSNFLKEVQSEWKSQTFLGKPVQFGDDRRLTALALYRGKVVISIEAKAWTKVPNDLYVFLKQQLRWNKSFLRESFLCVKEFGVNSFPGFFSFLELFFWVFYLVIISKIFFSPGVGTLTFIFIWLAYVIASGFFRNLSLIIREPRLILLSPCYSLVHVLVLTPLRLISLLTILDTRWGTR